MVPLYWLDQIQLTDHPRVGDLAYHLSQIMQRGLPVLPGFVISSTLFQQFLDAIPWGDPLLADFPKVLPVNCDRPQQLQAIAQHLRQTLINAPLPEEWLVLVEQAVERLGGAAVMLQPSLMLIDTPAIIPDALTQMIDTQVCWANPDAIAQAIKRVWADLFGAKALVYWQRRQIQPLQIQLGLVVQPVGLTICAGSLQTSSQHWRIQASWGLRTAIDRGEVIPDRYLIDQRGEIEYQQMGHKTIAYGLVDTFTDFDPASTPVVKWSESPHSFSPVNAAIQGYWLSDAKQQEFALPPLCLEQLIALIPALATDSAINWDLEWMVTQANPQAQPALWVTGGYPLALNSLSNPHPRLHRIDPNVVGTAQVWRGLGATSGQITAPAIVISAEQSRPERLPPNSVLVTAAIAPDWIPLLRQVVGVVTEQGGMTSHSAILTRELGIPSVLGVAAATQHIQSGWLLQVDGDRGIVRHLTETLTSQPVSSELRSQFSQSQPQPLIPSIQEVAPVHLDPSSGLAQPVLPAIATHLWVSLSQPTTIEVAKTLPVDGVGLIRSELILLESLEYQHPQHWLQTGRSAELTQRIADFLIDVASTFAPRPVFYRSFDFRAHEFQHLMGSPKLEENSTLGIRGTLSYQLDPSLFDLELTALVKVQQSGYDNLRLLLPFVRSTEEFAFCQRRVEQAGLRRNSAFQLWIMAEVPSVVFLLPEYVQAGVQGIAIGTNDLTQLLLGVDREQPQLDTSLDERHPAVQQAIAQLIRQAQQAGIPCSICGQAISRHPDLIDALVEWGITAISVDTAAVEQTYRAIARAEQRLILRVSRAYASDT